MLTKGKFEQGYDYISLQRQLETEQDAVEHLSLSQKKIAQQQNEILKLSFRV